MTAVTSNCPAYKERGQLQVVIDVPQRESINSVQEKWIICTNYWVSEGERSGKVDPRFVKSLWVTAVALICKVPPTTTITRPLVDCLNSRTLLGITWWTHNSCFVKTEK